MNDPIAFAASADPDTMYLHQAKKEPDWLNFRSAMQREVSSHENNDHWELVSRESVPEGVQILPLVWSMKQKRRISTERFTNGKLD